MARDKKDTKIYHELPLTAVEKIQSEIGQGHDVRAPLLRAISEAFKCSVLSFYTTHLHWQGTIMDGDAVMIKDILGAIGPITDLLLIIDSPGGDPHEAERIIKVCRELSSGNFKTLVPNKAKSAATMVCLGSEEVHMTSTSELGPVDVQVPWGERLLPAHLVIKSYEELMEKCSNTPFDKRVEPFLQQLQKYDAAQIESLRLARDLAQEIAKKSLIDGMMRKAKKAEVVKILRQFLDPEELKSHGRPIFYTDIKKVDRNEMFKVNCIPADSVVYPMIHEYHHRTVAHMAMNNLTKLCETVHTSFSAKIITG